MSSLMSEIITRGESSWQLTGRRVEKVIRSEVIVLFTYNKIMMTLDWE